MNGKSKFFFRPAILNTRSFLYVLTAAILLWLTLGAWALSSPIGASPDEDFHQTMIYCTANKTEKCLDLGTRYGHCFTMNPSASADCSNYSHLTSPKATFTLWTQYPPLYFKVMSLFVGDTLSITTMAVRLFNVSLTVIFSIGSILLSSKEIRPAVVMAWLVASMPTGLYFLSSLNPTSWIVMSIAAIWGPLLSLLKPDNTIINSKVNIKNKYFLDQVFIMRIIFVLSAASIGFGSRGEALLWFPLVIIGLIIFCVPVNFIKKHTKLSWPSILVLLIIIGMFTITVNEYGIQKFMRFFLISDSLIVTLEHYLDVLTWPLIQHTFNILIGVTGLPGVPGSGLGTHDVPVPAMAIIFIGYSLSACLMIALLKPYKSKLLALGFIILSVLFITSFLWSLQNWDYLQGRYFLPMLYPLIGLFLISKDNDIAGNKWQWASILISLAIANSLILLSIILRFMHGVKYQITRYPLTPNAPDINPERAFTQDLPLWWWPELSLSPSDLWIIGSLSFTLLMLIIWRWICESYFIKSENRVLSS